MAEGEEVNQKNWRNHFRTATRTCKNVCAPDIRQQQYQFSSNQRSQVEAYCNNVYGNVRALEDQFDRALAAQGWVPDIENEIKQKTQDYKAQCNAGFDAIVAERNSNNLNDVIMNFMNRRSFWLLITIIAVFFYFGFGNYDKKTKIKTRGWWDTL